MTVRSYSASRSTDAAKGIEAGQNVNVTLRLSRSDFAAVKSVALFHGISISAAIRDYIAAGLVNDSKIIDRRRP